MIRILLAVLAGVGAAGPSMASPEPPQGVEQVLARHVEALGGPAEIEALRNLRVRVEVVEPSFTVEGHYRATRDGQVRVDIFADGQRVFSEGIDAEGGWQQGGEGAEIAAISDAGLAALAHGIEFNIHGLHDVGSRGHRVALHGRETVDGTDYYVVELTMADGFRRYFYISPESWMIERTRETSALHPDLDSEERPAETVYGGFERHCSVLFSTRSRKVDLESGEELQRTQARSISCNEDPAALDIARPAGP